ncbi:restriction system-associated AAA family ATPase [Pelagicoccus mobilis]|uniref:Restriction system-associated AAA family ATPase n=1 Tax=Pelagicoccus mobilis TaxID=415221 RepID=A0A934VQ49_9BACT|nr:restriction system-associated AAA family ATPase [Pelagicoccus mobilis]MBK1877972.1 restriction system-associated AAA family ATPase [Pelagicoccus mobilis]
MRLLRVNIINADTCGGLLDGLDVQVRTPSKTSEFTPLCLIGPNGAGKSQFLQIVAEIFQSIFHTISPAEEREESNPSLQFVIEYLIHKNKEEPADHVKVSRTSKNKKKATLIIAVLQSDGTWKPIDIESPKAKELLPTKVVGYTSGDNETLSLPFLHSRSGYAEEVGTQALIATKETTDLPDTRLMLIDYGTNLEVLAANLLLASSSRKRKILEHSGVSTLHTFRCIIQLAHTAVPKIKKSGSSRKGIQLTDELEEIIERLGECSTCQNYDEKDECYTFDFFVDDEMSKAFSEFWKTSLELYVSLHKLAMLNDLAIPKKARVRFKKQIEARRFAARLPEPQDEDKVFRFERVSFRKNGSAETVDYVSLSDGEHQLAQLLGTFSMVSSPNVLFLLDEPESHFNPKWRVEFVSRILDLPTPNGTRRKDSEASKQDALLTTHAPFVPSDLKKEQVLIFSKDEKSGEVEVRTPRYETFGTTFDSILDECFDIRPPISREPQDEIERLRKSTDPDEIRSAMDRLGYSVEKAFLADRLRQLSNKD